MSVWIVRKRAFGPLRRLVIGLTILLGIQVLSPARAANPVPAPGTITTYAGGILGSILNDLFSAPQGVAVWATPDETFVYVADSQNHRIKKVIIRSGKPTGVINFAGGGIAGSSEDEIPAHRALLNFPTGLSVDSDGNLYIADTGNNRILKVAADAGHTITTVAGTGAPGFEGDGGDATKALLHAPYGVWAAPSGEFYVADTYNHRIRRVKDGKIQTEAGNESGGFSGESGMATAISLNFPRGVSSANGELYIADTYNHLVRKVSSDGTISTVAGDGTNGFTDNVGTTKRSRLSYPTQVLAIGSTETKIFISDTGNNRVRVTETSVDSIRTVAGSGDSPDQSQQALCVLEPRAVDSDSLPILAPTGIARFGDQLFVAATENHCLKTITSVGSEFNEAILDTLAGTGILPGCCADDGFPVSLARLFRPGSAAASGTMTYVADSGNNRVIAIDDKDKIITVAGKGCRTNDPDFPENDGPTRVERVDEEIKIYPGPTPTAVTPPYWSQTRTYSVGPTPADFILDTLDPRLADLSECSLGDGNAATEASLNNPWSVAVDSQGFLYVADTYNHRIRKVSPGANGIVDGSEDETITTLAGMGNPTSYVIYGDASSATNTGQVDPLAGGRHSPDLADICPEKKSEELKGQEKFCSEGFATEATLNFPYGVAESNGRLYIADAGNHRVRTVYKTTTGTLIDTVAGRGPCAHRHGCPSGNGWFATSQWLDGPRGVAVGPDGSVYIADTENNAIRKVTPGADGVVDGDPTEERMHTVIGGVLGHCDPSDCFFDPNYPDTLIAPVGPTLAGGGRVSRPQGVTVNDEGIVYFADTNNHRVRRVDPKNLKFLTIAGTGFEGFSGDGGPAPEAAMRYPGSIVFRGVDALLMDTENNRVRIVHSVEDGWGYIIECQQEIPQSDARRLNEPWPAGQKAQAIACRPTDI